MPTVIALPWTRYYIILGALAEQMEIQAAGRTVSVSNPDKVFFSKRGETKADLISYYLAIEVPLMAAMGGRPVLMERYPDGAGGKSFFQKRVPKGAPEWVRTMTVATPNGTMSNALVVDDIAHVVWAVQMGCLGFHVWPSKAVDPAHADELRIDLDPQSGVSFDEVKEAALETRAAFDELGMASYVKTSGSRGLHVYVPLLAKWNSITVRAAAVAMARELAWRRPDLVTDAWWKEERGQRVFIDYNQNAPHKTVFGAWSVRPRVGAVVSTPIDWDDVAGGASFGELKPDELTIQTVPARVAERGNPWVEMADSAVSLEPLLEWVRRDLDKGLMDAPWPPQYPKMPGEPPRVAPSRAKSES